jgi:hypothetical protein
MVQKITLSEKINFNKLQRVLLAGNIEQSSDKNTKQYKGMLAKVWNLSNMDFNDNKVEIKYNQKEGVGRVYGNGVQGIKTDIKKYICSDDNGVPYYQDIDIVNCLPNVLKRILQEREIEVPELLNDYVEDRAGVIHKLRWKDKQSFCTMSFNSELKYKKQSVVDYHNTIYETLFDVLKVEYLKLWNIINDTDPVNKKGKFISLVYQDIENDIMMLMSDFFKDKGFTVGVYCFDGIMVEKDDRINDELLVELEGLIKHELNYDIKLKEKPLTTEWVPEEGKGNIKDMFCKEVEKPTGNKYIVEYAMYLASLIEPEKNVIDKDAIDNLMNYLNDFLFKTDDPIGYFYRTSKLQIFKCSCLTRIKERFNLKVINYWLNSSKCTTYDRAEFIIDKDDNDYKNKDIYNSYVRPDYNIGDIDMSIIFDYINRVLCSNDDKLANYINEWITTLIQKGRTEQCIVLMGTKGCGKGSFYEIVKLLVGDEYSSVITDINRITQRFNSVLNRKSLILLDEVVSDAGTFVKIQNDMKGKITNKKLSLEFKGVDVAFDVTNNISYIITTNGFNPVQVTEDNRRYCIIDISESEKNNRDYFGKLYEFVENNKEQIRGYYMNRKCVNNLEGIRPKTKKELELLELNLSIGDRFIKDGLLFEDEDGNTVNELLYNDVYESFCIFCKNEGEKQYSKKWLTSSLNKAGYTNIRKGKSKITYLIKK